MKFSNTFLEIDNYLETHLQTITCHELFEIKNDFYNVVESLCGSTANLTGITELLVFRFVYHILNMKNPVENKAVHQDDIGLFIGNRYIGKNGKYQEPDIVIEQNGIIKYLFSIKNRLNTVTPNSNEKVSGLVKDLTLQNSVYTTSIQDIFRIENIRHGINNKFNSLTVVFSQVPPRHDRTNELIQQRFDWHSFLILENNPTPFLTELKSKLNLNIKGL